MKINENNTLGVQGLQAVEPVELDQAEFHDQAVQYLRCEAIPEMAANRALCAVKQ